MGCYIYTRYTNIQTASEPVSTCLVLAKEGRPILSCYKKPCIIVWKVEPIVEISEPNYPASQKEDQAKNSLKNLEKRNQYTPSIVTIICEGRKWTLISAFGFT